MQAPWQGAGVGGAPVATLELNGITVLYSASPPDLQPAGPSLACSAMEFYSVLKTVMERTAIIPFRFPTVLPGVKALQDELVRNQQWYRSNLLRLGDSVQMEAVLRHAEKSTLGTTSGTDYLRRRSAKRKHLMEAVSSLRATLASLISEEKVAEEQDAVRVYMLVHRSSLPELMHKSGSALAGEPIELAISGPWPPTMFLQGLRTSQEQTHG